MAPSGESSRSSRSEAIKNIADESHRNECYPIFSIILSTDAAKLV